MHIYVPIESVQNVSSYTIWKPETVIEEDTRYKKHCTQDNDTSVPIQSRHLGTSHGSPNPCSPNSHQAAQSYFPESHGWSEISSLSKVILVLGKTRSHRVPNLACRGTQSPGDLMFHQKVYMRHDAWAGALLWWSCQTPAVFAHSCGLLNHPNSFCERMFKLMAKFDAELLLYSFNHFECDDCTVQLLTQ